MWRLIIGVILVSMVSVSCVKQDEPYVLPPKGDASFQRVNMGANYEFQYFYNLKAQQIVHISRVADWDLSFESSFSGNNVFINGGKGLAVIPTETKNFYEVNEVFCEGKEWRLDNPSGGEESSVFGNWNQNQLTREKVYAIRLDADGNNIRKIKLKSVTNFGYVIEVADINASLGTEFFIEKKAHSNFTYFNLGLLRTVDGVEPLPEVWDIVFTRYGNTFYDQPEPLPYSVTGVLLNPLGTAAYKDSTRDFYSIEGSITDEIKLSRDRDIVGFDWKDYDIDKGVYNVRQYYNYIIETKEQDVFKLRFIDFYDDNGIKGSPSFELAQIK